MTWKDAPLYVEAHDLARWVSERAGAWADRGGRHLAARVGDVACSLLEAVALALTFPVGRASHLAEADRAIVRLRVLLRLARELGYLSPGGLRFACERLQTAGRMVGGWRKRLDTIDTGGGQSAVVDQIPGDGPPAAPGA